MGDSEGVSPYIIVRRKLVVDENVFVNFKIISDIVAEEVVEDLFYFRIVIDNMEINHENSFLKEEVVVFIVH